MNLLLESVIKGSLIIAAALIALRLLKGQPASLRHWLLATSLGLAAAQPVISIYTPAWSLSQASPLASVATEFQVVGLPAAEAPSAGEPRSRGTTPMDISQVALVIWLGGMALNVGLLLVGMCRLAWLRSASQMASGELVALERTVRDQLRVRQSVRIVLSSHPALLMAWGMFRPTILMPAASTSWSVERTRVVLAHEMAHVKRRDWAVQCGAEILRSVYWFNPLLWVACQQLRQESEYACDDMVLGLGVDRTAYATHLVDLARNFSAYGRTWLPAPAIARPSTLQRRVRAMLNPHLNRRPVAWSTRAGIAAALLCIVLPLSGFAMQSAAAIGGTVRDASGRVLPNAIVRLSPVDTDAVTQMTTDASGQFRFAGLAAGEYLLTTRSAGFSPLRQNVRVSARESISLPLTLQVGTLQETITVTSGPPRPGTRGAAGPLSQPAPPTCTSSATGGQIVPPRKLRDVKPKYDERFANAKGTVILDARIGTDGKVSQVEVFSGVHPDLEDAAIAAVSQWEFSPTYLNCEPVEVRMLVSVTFSPE